MTEQKIKVRFIDIGKGKHNWEAWTDHASASWLYDQVVKKLNDSNISIMDGHIFASGYRVVGKYELIREE